MVLTGANKALAIAQITRFGGGGAGHNFSRTRSPEKPAFNGGVRTLNTLGCRIQVYFAMLRLTLNSLLFHFHKQCTALWLPAQR